MKKSILLIDKDKQELGMFDDAIEQMLGSFDCTYAKDSLQALGVLQRDRPDIIFINYYIPPGNGLEFVAVVKTEPMLKDIRVFLYANYISDEINKMAHTLGAAGCIETTGCRSIFIHELKAILNPELLPAYVFLRRNTTFSLPVTFFYGPSD